MSALVPAKGTRVEHAIVRALITHLGAGGWEVHSLHDGVARVPLNSDRQALERVFLSEDSRLSFRKDDTRHWVRLIVGNGEDIVSDWSYSANGKDDFYERVEAFLTLKDKGIFELRSAK